MMPSAPDPGLGGFLSLESRIRDGRKSASGAVILDEQPASYFFELTNQYCFFVLKYLFLYHDP
jgi:hypothetical protein